MFRSAAYLPPAISERYLYASDALALDEESEKIHLRELAAGLTSRRAFCSESRYCMRMAAHASASGLPFLYAAIARTKAVACGLRSSALSLILRRSPISSHILRTAARMLWERTSPMPFTVVSSDAVRADMSATVL